MLNMNVGVVSTAEAVKKQFEDINEVIKSIMTNMDQNSVLVVTGNKAFDLSRKNSKTRENPTHAELIDGIEDEVVTPQGLNPHTGLFMYSKRPSRYIYDYREKEDLNYICPSPTHGNRIKKSRKAKPSSGAVSESLEDQAHINSNPSYLKLLNTFKSKVFYC